MRGFLAGLDRLWAAASVLPANPLSFEPMLSVTERRSKALSLSGVAELPRMAAIGGAVILIKFGGARLAAAAEWACPIAAGQRRQPGA